MAPSFPMTAGKAEFVRTAEASGWKTLRDEEDLAVVLIDDGIYGIAPAGRPDVNAFRRVLQTLEAETGHRLPFASIWTLEGVDEYDKELHGLYGMDEFKGRLSEITCIVTDSPLRRMVVNTMDLGLRAIGDERLMAVASLGDAVAKARSALQSHR